MNPPDNWYQNTATTNMVKALASMDLYLVLNLSMTLKPTTKPDCLIRGSYFRISFEHFMMNAKQLPHFISPFC